ncbi:MAG: M28 family peptidase [Halobaculum sp.]|jgi:hypothetical protein
MSQQQVDTGSLGGLESRVVEEISLEEPWALLERFSDLTRVTGTDDEAAAADYVCDRLSSLGVDYERHEPELYISQPHDASVDVLGRPFETGPVKTVAFSASTTVSGPVTFVGSAEDDITAGGDDGPRGPYHDVGDLSGQVAITRAGSLSIRATRVLAEKGAVGVIAVHEHDREPHSGIATPVWGGAPPYEERDKIPDVPIVNVNNPDGEKLIEWATTEDGIDVELETDLTTDWMECPVVVAEVEAEETDTDEFVLLHGHYDSWFVGITDNATGDAGLLECARVFDKFADELDRNLRIAWWPGHSTGRYAGSTWYADEFAHDIADNCVAQVNMDSPGSKDATEYTDMSCWCPEAHDLVTGAIDDVTGAPSSEQFPFRAGDYSFDNLGVTGFFMLSSNIPAEERDRRGYHEVGGCGGNSDAWHLSTDTLDTAGREELRRDIAVYATALTRVLTADVLPFDHRRTIQKITDRLDEYDEAAGDWFDFGPTVDALAAVESELEAFESAVDAGEVESSVANDVITELSRVLTRLYLVRDGQFSQDPAVSRDPVPRYAPAQKFPILDDHESRLLALQLKRAQNDVVATLRDARDAVRRRR